MKRGILTCAASLAVSALSFGSAGNFVQASALSKPVQGGTLTIATQDAASSLDPDTVTDAASEYVIAPMYDTLMRYTKTFGKVAPGIAKSYTVSPNGKTYTFHLNKGILFHHGNEVTAADVKYSIERVISMKVRASDFSAVQSISTPSKYTVVFHLKEPFAPFLTYLADPMNAIVDPVVVKAHHGSLAHVDAGSGPFELVSWKRGQYLELKRDPHYYLPGKPYLNKVIFKPISNETARITALHDKEVNMILDVPDQDINLLQKSSGITVKSVPGTFWEYIGLNTKTKPFNNIKVRQAVAWAVNREAMDKVIKYGHATVLDGGPIPPGNWAYAGLNVYPRVNDAKAKQLLAEAGYSKGLNVTLKVGSAFPYQVKAAEMLKEELQPIGINVNIESQESSVFFSALDKGQFQMDIAGWVGFVDPDQYLYNIFHTGGIYNQQGYSNPKVDALLNKGRTTTNLAQRKKIYKQAQKLIAKDAPMVFLYANQQTTAYLNNVHGFFVNPMDSTIFLRNTWISNN